ncbi:hypothetical protein [Meiothermus ruber]|uniref:Uncharacterized protein n=1 Tax=Meiothermus ruber (strain ATCC 35948 / DSM 1279 / VKM B-1258 / 21) TaxID=504728 RepID=D3PTF9_MEIRD|nr:hypothetical protein [Meiothermus ruber]ADD28742.1 hypothetical protein Mrub_1986 [Meiothermus ruber DSM 1279]AGK05810.1 hypothetical protein K649_12620 [Meiothermus ruber DSM 1279]
MEFSLAQVLQEIDRELALRRRVYNQLVRKGKMHYSDAEQHYLRMLAARRIVAAHPHEFVEMPDAEENAVGLYKTDQP